MNKQLPEQSSTDTKGKNTGVLSASGTAIGTAIGVVMGIAMDNIVAGIGIGLAIGIAMSGAFVASSRKGKQPD